MEALAGGSRVRRIISEPGITRTWLPRTPPLFLVFPFRRSRWRANPIRFEIDFAQRAKNILPTTVTNWVFSLGEFCLPFSGWRLLSLASNVEASDYVLRKSIPLDFSWFSSISFHLILHGEEKWDFIWIFGKLLRVSNTFRNSSAINGKESVGRFRSAIEVLDFVGDQRSWEPFSFRFSHSPHVIPIEHANSQISSDPLRLISIHIPLIHSELIWIPFTRILSQIYHFPYKHCILLSLYDTINNII